MLQCFKANYYALQNRNFSIISWPNAEHCSKHIATNSRKANLIQCIPLVNTPDSHYLCMVLSIFIISPAFPLGVTALKLKMHIIDAKKYIIVSISQFMKMKPEFFLLKKGSFKPCIQRKVHLSDPYIIWIKWLMDLRYLLRLIAKSSNSSCIYFFQ